MELFAGNWEGYEGNEDQEDQTTKIFMHEYFHIHQNALKFFFESTRTFGIPIAWQDDPDNSIYEEPPTQPWVFPNWIEEGGAEFAGMILAAKFDLSFDARFLFEQTLDEARNVVLTAANIGDTAILEFDACFPDSLIGITPIPGKAIPEYIEYALRLYQKELTRDASTGAQKNINYKFLKPLLIPIPKTIDMQKEIVQNIKSAEEKFKSQKTQFENIKENYENSITYVNHIQSSILDAAFSGKLVK